MNSYSLALNKIEQIDFVNLTCICLSFGRLYLLLSFEVFLKLNTNFCITLILLECYYLLVRLKMFVLKIFKR